MTRTQLLAATGGVAALVGTVLLTMPQVLESHNTPNGLHRVELADWRVHTPSVQVYEMFAVDLPDGAPRKIGKPTSNAEDCTVGFVVSRDSKRACYSQQNTALGTDRAVYCADISGTTWQRVSQLMVNGGGVRSGTIMLYGDGNRIAYWANPLGLEEKQYAVSVYGGEIMENVVMIDGFNGGNYSGWSGVTP